MGKKKSPKNKLAPSIIFFFTLISEISKIADMKQLTQKKKGTPCNPPTPEPEMKGFYVRLSPVLIERIKGAAYAARVPVQDITRQLLTQALNVWAK